jgi:hypothetical protein
MKTLENLPNEEIIAYLFNNKTADALEISAKLPPEESCGLLIYEDKTMKVYYCCKRAGNTVLEQFFIYSTWWGSIKNSFFTIGGDKGKSPNIRCGIIDREHLKEYKSKTNHEINNKNKVGNITVEDFRTFGLRIQREKGKSPTYKVKEVISQSPSLVKIEVTVPGYGTYDHTGRNKREAADDFARTFEEIVETSKSLS